MSPDLVFPLMLALKMVVAATFVTVATVAAEKFGPAVGALVATLPVSAGPAYVFLALDHDAAFISASALVTLALNAATAIYATVYVLLAQRHSIWISVPLAFAAWLALALVLGRVQWALWSALLLNLVAFPICFMIGRPFRNVRIPRARRRWYDFVVRAVMVALLVALVVTLSFYIGPAGTGVLAAFPVIYTSIMVLLHPRVGGPAAAAVLASAVPGLAGFGAAVLTLHLAAIPLGAPGALVLALAVSVVWNLTLYMHMRQRRNALASVTPSARPPST